MLQENVTLAFVGLTSSECLAVHDFHYCIDSESVYRCPDEA